MQYLNVHVKSKLGEVETVVIPITIQGADLYKIYMFEAEDSAVLSVHYDPTHPDDPGEDYYLDMPYRLVQDFEVSNLGDPCSTSEEWHQT